MLMHRVWEEEKKGGYLGSGLDISFVQLRERRDETRGEGGGGGGIGRAKQDGQVTKKWWIQDAPKTAARLVNRRATVTQLLSFASSPYPTHPPLPPSACERQPKDAQIIPTQVKWNMALSDYAPASSSSPSLSLDFTLYV